jgi:hypothetical protein
MQNCQVQLFRPPIPVRRSCAIGVMKRALRFSLIFLIGFPCYSSSIIQQLVLLLRQFGRVGSGLAPGLVWEAPDEANGTCQQRPLLRSTDLANTSRDFLPLVPPSGRRQQPLRD